MLEANGWKREVAGEPDFSNAVAALRKAYSLGLGILATGGAGNGKTAFLKAVMGMFGGNATWTYCLYPDDMEYLRAFPQEILDRDLYIDDIGAEEVVRDYGNVVDVVGNAIQRYHYRGKGRLFLSTNLRGNDLNARYGGRVLDRIFERCVILKLSGKSKRKMVVVG